MEEIKSIYVLMSAATALICVGGVWGWTKTKINHLERDMRDKAEEHKEKHADHEAKIDDLSESRAKVIVTMEHIKDKIDYLVEKIDRIAS